MNTKMSKLALAIGALVMAGSAMAQSTGSANGTANANVIQPITITAVDTLEFGNIVAGIGTVVIQASAAGTRSGTAALIGNMQGTERAGTFDVAGEGAAIYTITLPADDTVVLKTGAGDAPATQMKLSAFTNAIKGTGTFLTLDGTAGGAGAQSFYVGATLTSIATQTPGAYTGTYSVTVAYN